MKSMLEFNLSSEIPQTPLACRH